MCCKCLYVLLVIITGVLFYIFVPSEYWAEWITAISTFLMMIATGFMAVFAGKALDSWKNQQKREKLVNLLEAINEYIQELQYYELESTIFSKYARNNYQEDFSNKDLIRKQVGYVDVELAESFGKCILRLKNWRIEHSDQYDILNDINKKLNKYRIQVYNYVCMKINFFANNDINAQVLYGVDKEPLEIMKTKQEKIINVRKDLDELLNKFQDINKGLLK